MLALIIKIIKAVRFFFFFFFFSWLLLNNERILSFSIYLFSICQHWRYCLLMIINGLVPSTEIALFPPQSFDTSPSVWIGAERCIARGACKWENMSFSQVQSKGNIKEKIREIQWHEC